MHQRSLDWDRSDVGPPKIDENHSGPPIFDSIIKDPPNHPSSLSDTMNRWDREAAAGRPLAIHESYTRHMTDD